VFKLIALPIYNVTVSLLVDRIILILCFYISLQLKGNSKPYILEDGTAFVYLSIHFEFKHRMCQGSIT